MKYLISPDKQRYKVNLHCHSTVSDGDFTPEQIKAEYKARGYAAVAFTDHQALIGHADLCDDEFIALHGYEVDLNPGAPDIENEAFYKTYHVNLIAREQDQLVQPCFDPSRVPACARHSIPFVRYNGEIFPMRYSADCVNEMVRRANEQGFFAIYNHPFWSCQTYDDYATLEGVLGVEVYNTTCVVIENSADRTSAVYEDFLRLGKRTIPVAADDMHTIDALGGAWNTVLADSLSYRNLTAAIECGDTYASTGPEIALLAVDGDRIHLSTTPVKHVFLHIGRKRCARPTHHGGALFTDTVIDLPSDAPRFRLELIDEKGNRAYTRAYYAEEFR